jgi:hypothetical protein
MSAVNSDAHCARYQVKAFADAEKAEQWLAEIVVHSYHFLSMAAVASTNHFSKEMEGLVWVVVEKD